MTGNTDQDKKKVLNLYAAFGVSLLLSVVPSTLISVIALLFMVGVLVGAYKMRKAAEPHSLSENHCIFIIRTIWIATFISLISLAAGSAYMLSFIDYSAFEPCAHQFAAQGTQFIEKASFEQIYAMAEPCMNSFIHLNFQLLMVTAVITAAPVLIYVAYRYIKGLSRALKGYRLAHPESLF